MAWASVHWKEHVNLGVNHQVSHLWGELWHTSFWDLWLKSNAPSPNQILGDLGAFSHMRIYSLQENEVNQPLDKDDTGNMQIQSGWDDLRKHHRWWWWGGGMPCCLCIIPVVNKMTLAGWFKGKIPKEVPNHWYGWGCQRDQGSLLLVVQRNLCPEVQAFTKTLCGANKEVRRQAFKRSGIWSEVVALPLDGWIDKFFVRGSFGGSQGSEWDVFFPLMHVVTSLESELGCVFHLCNICGRFGDLLGGRFAWRWYSVLHAYTCACGDCRYISRKIKYSSSFTDLVDYCSFQSENRTILTIKQFFNFLKCIGS